MENKKDLQQQFHDMFYNGNFIESFDLKRDL